MKIIIFLLIPILLLSCKGQITSPKEKFFNPKDLDNLSLENIEYFWQGDTAEIWIDPIPNFNKNEGYLKGFELRGDLKEIGVFVFKTQAIAISAFENYKELCSALINDGENNDLIKEKWWYIEGDPYYAIMINKYNTLVMLHNYYSYENVLMDTAIEIMRRIDIWSN